MNKTQRIFNALLTVTAITSLLSALSDNLIPTFSLQKLLSLSLNGIKQGHLWQLVSYLFVQPLDQGVTFSFLFRVAFNSYLLWFLGGSILHKRGMLHFLSLYFLGGLIAGLAILGLLFTTTSLLFYAGNMTGLYSLMIAWITLNPKATLPFLLGIPIKAKNIVFISLGINLFIDLSSGNWIYAISYLIAALFGYLYGRLIRTQKEAPLYTQAKIFDFKTGKAVLNDEQFLEEMLSKISFQGKKSLTWKERFRLRKITKRQKKNRNRPE
ncbi:MAG: rhomboid family intramembrane serine protease [Chlamydiota bacterium]